MSVNPLLTNYNALGGSLFAPASGGGGGSGGPNLIVSTLLAASATPGAPQLAATFDGTPSLNSKAVIAFNSQSSEVADVGIRFNAASTWDTYISNITGVAAGSGVLLFDGITHLSTSGAANLTISSINGAAPGGGGGGSSISALNSLVQCTNQEVYSVINAGTASESRVLLNGNTGNPSLDILGSYPGSTSLPNIVMQTDGGPFPGYIDIKTNYTSPVTLRIGKELAGSTYGPILATDATNIYATDANLNISTINGVVPGSGGGAISIALPINTNPTNLADFATTISPASAVAVSANPLITITSLPIGWYTISIPRFLLCPAQSTPGTAAPGTTVPYGTFVSYFLRVGTGATTSDNFLAMFPIVPEGTGVVTSTQSETRLYGTFYNPVATPFDTFTLYTYATTPTGTTGIGNWCQILSSVGGIAAYAIITPLPT